MGSFVRPRSRSLTTSPTTPSELAALSPIQQQQQHLQSFQVGPKKVANPSRQKDSSSSRGNNNGAHVAVITAGSSGIARRSLDHGNANRGRITPPLAPPQASLTKSIPRRSSSRSDSGVTMTSMNRDSPRSNYHDADAHIKREPDDISNEETQVLTRKENNDGRDHDASLHVHVLIRDSDGSSHMIPKAEDDIHAPNKDSKHSISKASERQSSFTVLLETSSLVCSEDVETTSTQTILDDSDSDDVYGDNADFQLEDSANHNDDMNSMSSTGSNDAFGDLKPGVNSDIGRSGPSTLRTTRCFNGNEDQNKRLTKSGTSTTSVSSLQMTSPKSPLRQSITPRDDTDTDEENQDNEDNLEERRMVNASNGYVNSIGPISSRLNHGDYAAEKADSCQEKQTIWEHDHDSLHQPNAKLDPWEIASVKYYNEKDTPSILFRRSSVPKRSSSLATAPPLIAAENTVLSASFRDHSLNSEHYIENLISRASQSGADAISIHSASENQNNGADDGHLTLFCEADHVMAKNSEAIRFVHHTDEVHSHENENENLRPSVRATLISPLELRIKFPLAPPKKPNSAASAPSSRVSSPVKKAGRTCEHCNEDDISIFSSPDATIAAGKTANSSLASYKKNLKSSELDHLIHEKPSSETFICYENRMTQLQLQINDILSREYMQRQTWLIKLKMIQKNDEERISLLRLLELIVLRIPVVGWVFRISKGWIILFLHILGILLGCHSWIQRVLRSQDEHMNVRQYWQDLTSQINERRRSQSFVHLMPSSSSSSSLSLHSVSASNHGPISEDSNIDVNENENGDLKKAYVTSMSTWPHVERNFQTPDYHARSIISSYEHVFHSSMV